MGDMERARAEVAMAEAREVEISDATARVIASMYHGGQASRGYLLASTGNIGETAEGLCLELFGEYGTLDIDAQHLYDAMGTYLLARVREGRTGPVEGWSQLWLD